MKTFKTLKPATRGLLFKIWQRDKFSPYFHSFNRFLLTYKIIL